MHLLQPILLLCSTRFGWLLLLMIGVVTCSAHSNASAVLLVDKEKPKKQRPIKDTSHQVRWHMVLQELASQSPYRPTVALQPYQSVQIKPTRIWNPFSRASIQKTSPILTSQTVMVGPLISFLLVALLLLAVPTLFLIGGLIGGIGWLIIGAVAATIWLFLAYLIALLKAPYVYDFGLIIFIFLSAVFIAGFVWALIAVLPTLLIFSGIFGGLALIGIGIYIAYAIT